MKLVPIVAVRDSMQGFTNVYIVPNIAVGQRGFVNSCTVLLQQNDENSLSVSDLSLYYVGDFNLETGEIFPMDKKIIATPPAVFNKEICDDDN